MSCAFVSYLSILSFPTRCKPQPSQRVLSLLSLTTATQDRRFGICACIMTSSHTNHGVTTFTFKFSWLGKGGNHPSEGTFVPGAHTLRNWFNPPLPHTLKILIFLERSGTISPLGHHLYNGLCFMISTYWANALMRQTGAAWLYINLACSFRTGTSCKKSINFSLCFFNEWYILN